MPQAQPDAIPIDGMTPSDGLGSGRTRANPPISALQRPPNAVMHDARDGMLCARKPLALASVFGELDHDPRLSHSAVSIIVRL